MIDVRKSLRGGSEVSINMGPLIDMVFLLLIFFVVTTSFVRETGIEVQRSQADTAEVVEHATIMLGVSAEGHVYFEGRRVDVRSVRGLVERALAEDPEAGVVIKAMDQCRLAGAQSVSLAAIREAES